MIHSTTDERGVVTLTIDRPERRNALDQSLTMGLHLNQLLDAGGSFSRGGAAFAERQAKKDR